MKSSIDTCQTFKKFQNFISTEQFFKNTECVFVGFSGGADSTALLLLLQKMNLPLTAVHINHNLRGTRAENDALWCRDFCTKNSIPFLCFSVKVLKEKKTGESIEAAARRCRLDIWKKLCDGKNSAVALGHHLDDCIENLFLRLARGSNTSGIAGLRSHTNLAGVKIIRPLLCLRRAEILDFLKNQKINWCEDETNQDNSFARNALRNRLLPLWLDIFGNDTGLLRAISNINEDANYLEEQAAKETPKELYAQQIQNSNPAMAVRILQNWLLEKSGRKILLNRGKINALKKVLKNKSKRERKIAIAQKLFIHIGIDGKLHLEKQSSFQELKWDWQNQNQLKIKELEVVIEAKITTLNELPPTNNETIVFFKLDEIPPELTIRIRKPGDHIQCFNGTTKKVQNIFINAKIPRHRRDLLPLIFIKEKLIWIPGFCRSNFAPIEKFPCQVLQLNCTKI